MRIVSYAAACSLDGFIAGEDGSIYWLHFSTDVQDGRSPRSTRPVCDGGCVYSSYAVR